MKCVRCGTELKEGSKVCLGCGFEVGKEYVPEQNETLESLMEMPKKEETYVDDAEEMEIEGSKKELDVIDGEEVKLDNNLTGENVGKVKVRKKKKYFLLFIPLVLILLGLLIYFNFDKIKCLYKDCSVKPSPKPSDDKVDVVNHPTETYIFDNRFTFRLTDEWNETEKGKYTKNLEEFKTNKYVLNNNTLEDYLKYIGTEEYKEETINNIKYYYIVNNQAKEYAIIDKEAIYVFSFVSVNEKDINEIMNTVVYYK